MITCIIIIIVCVEALIVWACTSPKQNWKLVASSNETWFKTYNDIRLEGSDYTRTLVLERCALSGEERAYYYDRSECTEVVPVGAAKARLGVMDIHTP